MIPSFNKNGVLPPGNVHKASWSEFAKRFGANERREYLLTGLEAALSNLRNAGCDFVYIDGGFVTAKEESGDWDGCWQLDRVNVNLVDPVIIDADLFPDKMKKKYKGDLVVHAPRLPGGDFVGFFQNDRDGMKKGIILLDLRTLP